MAGSTIAQNTENPQWVQYTYGEHVTALAEEGDFLWIGTSTGLVRFDKSTGERTAYNYFNSGLPSYWVNTIAVDTEGTKWIGTNAGLTSFDGVNWTTYNTSNSGINDNNVECIVIDKEGVKWFAACLSAQHTDFFYGLTSFDGSTWQNYNSSNSAIPSDKIISLDTDNQGLVWIGTNVGLASYDGSTWTLFNKNNSGLPENYVSAIAIDKNNVLWISCSDNSFRSVLVTYYNNNWNIELDGQSFFSEIDIDINGDKWMYNYGPFICSYNDTTILIHDISDPQMPTISPSIHTILIDDKGTKWIGSTIGLISFDNIGWDNHSMNSLGLWGNLITSIKVKDEIKWITNDIGLVSFDNNNWEEYKIYDTTIIIPTHSTDICFDHNGQIWTSFIDYIAKFDGTNWTTYFYPYYYDYIHFFNDFEIDDQGIIWSAYEKLLSFDGKQWMTYEIPGIGESRVYDLEIDSDGKIWLAYCINGQGFICSFDGLNWTIFNSKNTGLTLFDVCDISIDNKNRKWIGSRLGLICYDGTDWTIYNSTNSPLPFNFVNHVHIDDSARICVSLFEHIDVGKYKTAIAYFDGTTWSSVTNLPFSISSISLDKNGTAWIGTTYQGLVAYNPNGVPLSKPETIKPEMKELKVYPNPSSTSIMVEVSGRGELSIINLNGQVLINHTLSQKEETIDISNIPRGIYILRFISGENVDAVKLVKE